MNISAPASVPDLAVLALLLAARPEATAAIPGFAPPQSLPAGAGTFHTFGSTLADVLSVEEKPEGAPEEDPKQQAVNALITGVPVPAPAPETLPFAFAMQFHQGVKAETSELEQASARWELLPGAGHRTNVMPRKASLSPLSPPVSPQTVSTQPEDTAAPFTFTVPALKPCGPEPAPRVACESVLAIVEPRAATVPELAPAPELPNLAFAEKFTPVPASQEGATLPAAHSLPSTSPISPAPPILPTLSVLTPQPTPPTLRTPDTPPTLAVPLMPRTDAVRPVTDDRPTQFANNQTESVPPPPAGNSGEPDHAPGSRHGNEERQRSSGESLPQPRAYTEAVAREEARVEKPTLEPLAPVSISPQQTPPSESFQAAPAVKHAETRHLEPEPDRLQAAPTTHAPDTHAITVRLTDAGDARVELKVTEHAGEVRVSVRTADPDLAGSLRENLGDLVHKLEKGGFRADTWHPSQSSAPETNLQSNRSDGESLGEDHSGRQQQHSGDGRQRKQQDPDRASWIDELETRFAPDSERKEPTWLSA